MKLQRWTRHQSSRWQAFQTRREELLHLHHVGSAGWHPLPRGAYAASNRRQLWSAAAPLSNPLASVRDSPVQQLAGVDGALVAHRERGKLNVLPRWVEACHRSRAVPEKLRRFVASRARPPDKKGHAPSPTRTQGLLDVRCICCYRVLGETSQELTTGYLSSSAPLSLSLVPQSPLHNEKRVCLRWCVQSVSSCPCPSARGPGSAPCEAGSSNMSACVMHGTEWWLVVMRCASSWGRQHYPTCKHSRALLCSAPGRKRGDASPFHACVGCGALFLSNYRNPLLISASLCPLFS